MSSSSIQAGTEVEVEKLDGEVYRAIYCGQKDGYYIVGSKGRDFCIESFTEAVTDFQDCGCQSFRFVKPKYVRIWNATL